MIRGELMIAEQHTKLKRSVWDYWQEYKKYIQNKIMKENYKEK